MMQKMRQTAFLFSACGVIVAGLLLYMSCLMVFGIKRYSCYVDPLIAPSLAHHIKVSVDRMHIQGLSIQQIHAQLQKEFPCIKALHAQRIAPGVLHCDLIAAVPLLNINDTHVITDSGLIVPNDQFAQVRLRYLYTLYMQQVPVTVTQELQQCVAHLSPSLCARYKIFWRDEFHVELQDKHEPNFSVVCTATMLPDKELLQRCYYCKQQLVQAFEQGRKGPACLMADVRFNKQIILYGEKGGGAYG